VAHLGVERLGAGDGEYDAAHGDEGDERVLEDEGQGVRRRQREQDCLGVHDVRDAKHGQRDEPQRHDGAESSADDVRCAASYSVILPTGRPRAL